LFPCRRTRWCFVSFTVNVFLPVYRFLKILLQLAVLLGSKIINWHRNLDTCRPWKPFF
jgi:hypothetical protein